MYAFYGGKSITAAQPDIAGPLQTQGLPESGDVWKLYSACWFNGSNYVSSGRVICVRIWRKILLRTIAAAFIWQYGSRSLRFSEVIACWKPAHRVCIFGVTNCWFNTPPIMPTSWRKRPQRNPFPLCKRETTAGINRVTSTGSERPYGPDTTSIRSKLWV